jgi:predicted DNA-binding transcriptional regulator AlpA
MPTGAQDHSSESIKDELLSVAQITQELKISRRTFYRWRELHIAPPSLRLPNGEIRVFRSSLAQWLEHLGEQFA